MLVCLDVVHGDQLGERVAGRLQREERPKEKPPKKNRHNQTLVKKEINLESTLYVCRPVGL